MFFSQLTFADINYAQLKEPLTLEINELDSTYVNNGTIFYTNDSNIYLETGGCSGEEFNSSWGFIYVYYDSFGPFDILFGAGGFKLPREEGVTCTYIYNELSKASKSNPVSIEIDFQNQTVIIL